MLIVTFGKKRPERKSFLSDRAFTILIEKLFKPDDFYFNHKETTVELRIRTIKYICFVEFQNALENTPINVYRIF